MDDLHLYFQENQKKSEGLPQIEVPPEYFEDVRRQNVPPAGNDLIGESPLVRTAKHWVGKSYKPGEEARCADWVSCIATDAGVADFKPSLNVLELAQNGQPIQGKENLQPGDLLFFDNTYMDTDYTHVGIYSGNGEFVHRPSSDSPVRTDTINSGYYADKFNSGRRLNLAGVDTSKSGGRVTAGVYISPENLSEYDPQRIQHLVTAIGRNYFGDDGARIFLDQLIAESNLDPSARSHVGAMGISQMMPETLAGELSEFNRLEGTNYTVEDFKQSPQLQIVLGAQYMRKQLDAYGNWADALAAYNSGPGGLQNQKINKSAYEETRNYVAKILHTSPEQAEQWITGSGAIQFDGTKVQNSLEAGRVEFVDTMQKTFSNMSKMFVAPTPEDLNDPFFAENMEFNRDFFSRYLSTASWSASALIGQLFGTDALIPSYVTKDESIKYKQAKEWWVRLLGYKGNKFLLGTSEEGLWNAGVDMLNMTDLAGFLTQSMLVHGMMQTLKIPGTGFDKVGQTITGKPVQGHSAMLWKTVLDPDTPFNVILQQFAKGTGKAANAANWLLGSPTALRAGIFWGGWVGMDHFNREFARSLADGNTIQEAVPHAMWAGMQGALLGGTLAWGIPTLLTVGGRLVHGLGDFTKDLPDAISQILQKKTPGAYQFIQGNHLAKGVFELPKNAVLAMRQYTDDIYKKVLTPDERIYLESFTLDLYNKAQQEEFETVMPHVSKKIKQAGVAVEKHGVDDIIAMTDEASRVLTVQNDELVTQVEGLQEVQQRFLQNEDLARYIGAEQEEQTLLKQLQKYRGSDKYKLLMQELQIGGISQQQLQGLSARDMDTMLNNRTRELQNRLNELTNVKNQSQNNLGTEFSTVYSGYKRTRDKLIGTKDRPGIILQLEDVQKKLAHLNSDEMRTTINAMRMASGEYEKIMDMFDPVASVKSHVIHDRGEFERVYAEFTQETLSNIETVGPTMQQLRANADELLDAVRRNPGGATPELMAEMENLYNQLDTVSAIEKNRELHNALDEMFSMMVTADKSRLPNILHRRTEEIMRVMPGGRKQIIEDFAGYLDVVNSFIGKQQAKAGKVITDGIRGEKVSTEIGLEVQDLGKLQRLTADVESFLRSHGLTRNTKGWRFDPSTLGLEDGRELMSRVNNLNQTLVEMGMPNTWARWAIQQTYQDNPILTPRLIEDDTALRLATNRMVLDLFDDLTPTMREYRDILLKTRLNEEDLSRNEIVRLSDALAEANLFREVISGEMTDSMKYDPLFVRELRNIAGTMNMLAPDDKVYSAIKSGAVGQEAIGAIFDAEENIKPEKVVRILNALDRLTREGVVSEAIKQAIISDAIYSELPREITDAAMARYEKQFPKPGTGDKVKGWIQERLRKFFKYESPAGGLNDPESVTLLHASDWKNFFNSSRQVALMLDSMFSSEFSRIWSGPFEKKGLPVTGVFGEKLDEQLMRDMDDTIGFVEQNLQRRGTSGSVTPSTFKEKMSQWTPNRYEPERVRFIDAIENPKDMYRLLNDYPELAKPLAIYKRILGLQEKYINIDPTIRSTLKPYYLAHQYPYAGVLMRMKGSSGEDAAEFQRKFTDYARKYPTIKDSEAAAASAVDRINSIRREMARVNGLDPDMLKAISLEDDSWKEFIFGPPGKKSWTDADRFEWLGFTKDMWEGGVSGDGAYLGVRDFEGFTRNADPRAEVEKLVHEVLLGFPEKDPAKALRNVIISLHHAAGVRRFLTQLSNTQTDDGNTMLMHRRGTRNFKPGYSRSLNEPLTQTPQGPLSESAMEGYKQLSSLPGFSDVSLKNKYGQYAPAGEWDIHPSAAKMLQEFFNYDPATSNTFMDRMARHLRTIPLAGSPVPFLNTTMSNLMVSTGTSAGQASGVIKFGEQISRTEPELMIRAMDSGVDLNTVTKNIRLFMEDIKTDIPIDDLKRVYGLDPASKIDILNKLDRGMESLAGNIESWDKFLNQRTLFNAIRWGQLGNFWHQHTQLINSDVGQRLIQTYGDNPMAAIHQMAKVSADYTNFVAAGMPAWWHSSGFRKGLYRYVLTPRVTGAIWQGMLGALDNVLTSPALKARSRFAHIADPIARKMAQQKFANFIGGGMLAGLVFANLMNYGINGHSTFLNAPGKELHIKMGENAGREIYVSNPFFGMFRPYAKALNVAFNPEMDHKWQEATRIFTGRTTTIMQMLVELAMGETTMGQPIFKHEDQGLVKNMIDLGKYFTNRIVPTEYTGTEEFPYIGAPQDRNQRISTWVGAWMTEKQVYRAERLKVVGAVRGYEQELKQKVREKLLQARKADDAAKRADIMQEAYLMAGDGIDTNKKVAEVLRSARVSPDGKIRLTRTQMDNLVLSIWSPTLYEMKMTPKALRSTVMSEFSDLIDTEELTGGM